MNIYCKNRCRIFLYIKLMSLSGCNCVLYDRNIITNNSSILNLISLEVVNLLFYDIFEVTFIIEK